jgi:hypothetical protein
MGVDVVVKKNVLYIKNRLSNFTTQTFHKSQFVSINSAIEQFFQDYVAKKDCTAQGFC